MVYLYLMKKPLVCLVVLVLAAVCLIGPAATLPAMACGPGAAGCCQAACNCGMSNQAPAAMPLAALPVATMASFDPSLMAQAAQLSVPQAAPDLSRSTDVPPSDERSEKEKLYDAQSNYRL